MMKQIAIGMSLAALVAGSAYALDRPADGKATITRADAQARSAEMFARMDANKDGKLDAADRAARQAARFDAIDTDKNGQISRAEFTAERPDRGGMEGPGGRGHGKDHGKHGRHHGGMKQGPAGLGAGADGTITQAEFTAAALQRFDRADVNKDGQVTQEERRAARDLKRQRAAPPPPQS